MEPSPPNNDELLERGEQLIRTSRELLADLDDVLEALNDAATGDSAPEPPAR